MWSWNQCVLIVSCQSPGDPIGRAIVVWRARHDLVGRRVVRVVARQHEWPVIVVELVRKEERPGETVVLGAVMAVVLVRGNRVYAKAAVLADVDGQPVVMPEEHRLAVSREDQLGRNRAVEGPHGLGILRRPLRMERQWNRRRGDDPGIQR